MLLIVMIAASFAGDPAATGLQLLLCVLSNLGLAFGLSEWGGAFDEQDDGGDKEENDRNPLHEGGYAIVAIR